MAALHPAPPLRPWADLPGDVLYEILRHVQCAADRGSAALACRPWLEAFNRAAPPPPPRPLPLPWLLLPSADGSFRASCALSGGAAHHHHLPVASHGARYFGSYDGAWLFRVFRRQGVHQLVNARTGYGYALPATFRPFDDALGRFLDIGMLILAATLSAPPGDRRCVAAGIVADSQDRFPVANIGMTKGRVVFWRMGAAVALDFSSIPLDPALDAEDIIYYAGAFHVLTQSEHIRVYGPTLPRNGRLGVVRRLLRFVASGRTYGEAVHSRYLVMGSRGDLLMVVRLTLQLQSPTSRFRVFRMVPIDAAANVWHWDELHTLEGQMLFVGRCCSRAYDVNRYRGLEEGVYFLDDSSFYGIELSGGANARTYPCVDNGKWSERGVERCFTPLQEASDYSPPVWLLP
ncbi:hypothetical protein ACP70R_001585 [Stipagrostis hirtigluma subsp. patula]